MVVAALAGIAENVGANRCQPGQAIPHPFGDPSLSPEQEKAMRVALTRKALDRLSR